MSHQSYKQFMRMYSTYLVHLFLHIKKSKHCSRFCSFDCKSFHSSHSKRRSCTNCIELESPDFPVLDKWVLFNECSFLGVLAIRYWCSPSHHVEVLLDRKGYYIFHFFTFPPCFLCIQQQEKHDITAAAASVENSEDEENWVQHLATNIQLIVV